MRRFRAYKRSLKKFNQYEKPAQDIIKLTLKHHIYEILNPDLIWLLTSFITPKVDNLILVSSERLASSSKVFWGELKTLLYAASVGMNFLVLNTCRERKLEFLLRLEDESWQQKLVNKV